MKFEPYHNTGFYTRTIILEKLAFIH